MITNTTSNPSDYISNDEILHDLETDPELREAIGELEAWKKHKNLASGRAWLKRPEWIKRESRMVAGL